MAPLTGRFAVEINMARMKLPAASCGVSQRNCAVAGPAFAQKSCGAVRLAFHPYSKLQGIQAKANKNSLMQISCKDVIGNTLLHFNKMD